MADQNRRDNLPDISGVFNVDESDIPAGVIQKPREPQRRVSSYRSDPVMSRPSEQTSSRRAAASEENRRGYAARQRAEYEEEQRRARAEQRAAYTEENRRGYAARQREDYYEEARGRASDRYAEEDDAYEQPVRRAAAQASADRAYRAARHEDTYADRRREREADRRYGSLRRYEADRAYDGDRRQYARAERMDDAREEAMRRQQRQRAARKRNLRRMLPGVAVPVLIVIAVVAIIIAAKVNRTPKVVVAKAADASVENYTEFDAVAVRDPSGTGEDRVYVAFVCNTYEEAGIADGSKVNLVFPDGSVVLGGVTQILNAQAKSPLLETIGAALPQTAVSPDENHVVLVLPDDSSACEEGATMRAQVVTEESANVLTVPVTALRTDGAAIYVWVFKETGLSKKIERRDVSVGLVSADSAEITEGLKSGEKVVVGSNRMPAELVNGMRVRLEDAPEATTAAPAEAD